MKIICHISARLLAVLALIANLSIVPLSVALADQNVPFPTIAKGLGEAHPEGNEAIRKNHPTLLSHQRDETMRQGKRPLKESLKACLACHQVRDNSGDVVGKDDPRFFCTACHSYTATTIDCFQCHNDRPKFTQETLERLGLNKP